MKLQKLQRIGDRKVTKLNQKQKNNKDKIISVQHKHNFRRLKKPQNTNAMQWYIFEPSPQNIDTMQHHLSKQPPIGKTQDKYCLLLFTYRNEI